MIYLIDDNQNNQRLENYNITFVDEEVFKGYLTPIERLQYKSDLNDLAHLDFLRNADCILLHSTTEDFEMERGFLPGSKTNSMKIKENISQEGEIIPLVLFSNSMGEAEYNMNENPNYIRAIKKNLMYERLFDFMTHYRETNKVELRILAWGKHYEAQEIGKLAIDILNATSSKNDSEIVSLADLSPVLDKVRSFLEISLPETDVNTFIDQLEDHPMSVADFRKRIRKITESYSKYGKNIHTWE